MPGALGWRQRPSVQMLLADYEFALNAEKKMSLRDNYYLMQTVLMLNQKDVDLTLHHLLWV